MAFPTYRMHFPVTAFTGPGLRDMWQLLNPEESEVIVRVLRIHFRANSPSAFAVLPNVSLARTERPGAGTDRSPAKFDTVSDPAARAVGILQPTGVVAGEVLTEIKLQLSRSGGVTLPFPFLRPRVEYHGPGIDLYEHLEDGIRLPLTLHRGQGLVVRIDAVTTGSVRASGFFDFAEEPAG